MLALGVTFDLSDVAEFRWFSFSKSGRFFSILLTVRALNRIEQIYYAWSYSLPTLKFEAHSTTALARPQNQDKTGCFKELHLTALLVPFFPTSAHKRVDARPQEGRAF